MDEDQYTTEGMTPEQIEEYRADGRLNRYLSTPNRELQRPPERTAPTEAGAEGSAPKTGEGT